MQETWTVGRTLDWCCEYLQRHGDENPRLSAQWLLSAATGLSKVELYAYHDRPLAMEERDVLRESLKRRAKGEPLQYISGETAFRHLVVKTAKGVLIPRPETEMLVELVLEWLDGRAGEQVLEVGVGTGCVALSLAKEAGVHVTATDISDDAIGCARRNAEMLGLDELVTVVKTDCVEGVEDSFDCIVSNPPYIPSSVVDELDHEVLGFEPRLALDGGADGLDFFDRLICEALPLLRDEGFFACELHEECLDDAVGRLREAGMTQVQVVFDLTGRKRFVTCVKA